MTKQITIAGVSISFPDDMVLTYSDMGIELLHNFAVSSELNVTSVDVEMPDGPPPYKPRRHYKPRGILPTDFNKRIVRHMRENEGKAYQAGIVKTLLPAGNRTPSMTQQVRSLLEEMVRSGVLIILSNEGHRLYGLVSMQARSDEYTDNTHQPQLMAERNDTTAGT